MSYPSLEQYQIALQHPQTVFLDAALRTGKIASTGLGQPKVMCGGFALTYAVTVGGSKFAVRCFHRQSPNLERRYAAIGAKLEQLASAYFVQFKFEPKGVRIDGSNYPIVKMAWSEGDTLGVFVSDHYRKAAAMNTLRTAFTALASFLEAQGIAHGDIQPGNLMVSSQGSVLKLIDYDGMFVPAIQTLGAAEIGHRNFQHPDRAQAGFGPALDRFSLVLMYVSLKAIEIDSRLWEETQSDYDAFLFRSADFEDPAGSLVFRKLKAIPALAAQANAFAAICGSRFEQTPTLSDFIAGRNIPVPLVVAKPKPSGQPAYVSQYAVLNAADFGLFRRAVGGMVELVGQVVEVSRKKTKYGRPFIFVNFGSWRANIVKLTIWSEALGKILNPPTASWVGKWVTVVGLVETYTASGKYHYTHLSIDITSQHQIKVITEQEARFRLGAPPPTSLTTNQQVIDRMRTGATTAASGGAQRHVPAANSNAAILQKMRATSTAQHSSTASPRSPTPLSAQRPTEGIGTRILRFLGFK